jgi:hypothetical protein
MVCPLLAFSVISPSVDIALSAFLLVFIVVMLIVQDAGK